MKTVLACCCAILLYGCQDNPSIPKIVDHEVWIETSSTFVTSNVLYYIGTQSGSSFPGSLKFEDVTPGTAVGVTISGSNPYNITNTGNISAAIYVDGVLWRSGSESPGTSGSLSLSGVIPQ